MKRDGDGVKGDQEVAVKREKEARSQAARWRTRLTRLQAISEVTAIGASADQVSEAAAALRKLRDAADPTLSTIKVRSGFIRRRALPEGEMSDRRRPAAPVPPVIQLAAPRGIAQQLELVALFVAQTTGRRRRDGHVTRLGLDLEPAVGHDVGWIDVVVPHSGHTPAAVIAANRRDNRLRQVKRAVSSLADKGLAELPNTSSARGKYEDFQLLDEGGVRGIGPPLPYRVPASSEPVIEVPVDFFLNGWVFVLTKSEIALWLMLRDRRGPAPVDSDVQVQISGADRLRLYGLTKDAYKQWWLLERAGLIEVQVDPMRRGDGTVIEFDPADPPAPHRFALSDDGLSKPAAPAVKAALAAAIDREPIGVARVNSVLSDNLPGL